MSRREKLRQEMLEDIKATARKQMTENGTAAVSLSAIARALEVSQPALYRYYASRDDLITALIVDAYNDLASTIEATSAHFKSEPAGIQLREVLLSYRRWALERPTDFQLIFGNPIPGYIGPEDVTVPAARRVFAVILAILQKAYQTGVLRPLPEYEHLPENMVVDLPLEEGRMLPKVVTYVGVIGWCRIHGMITLEMLKHTTALLPDPEAFYRFEVESLLRSMGMMS